MSLIGHDTHIRIAWYLLRDDRNTGSQRIRDMIKSIIAVCDVLRLDHGIIYHETKTEAWIRILSACLDRSNPPTFKEFVATHPEVMSSSLLLKYWSQEIIDSKASETRWIEPDVKAID